MASTGVHVKEYVNYVLHPESHSFAMNSRNRVISAAAATVVAETLIAPTNVIKERQLEYMRKQPTSTKIYQMPSITQITKNVISENGYMGLFHGYYSILFKQIGYKSLVLFSYEPIRNQLSDWKKKYFQRLPSMEPSHIVDEVKDKIQQVKQQGKQLTTSPYAFDGYSKSALVCLLSGGLSGIIGYTLVHPVEALSSPTFASPSQLPTDATTERMKQMKQAGKSRFWLKPNLMYVFLIYATEFGGYDYIKAYIMNNSNFATRYNMSLTYILSAAIAGTLSAFVSVPADIIRNRSMDPVTKAKSSEGALSHIMKQIGEEGTYVFRKKLMVNMVRKTLWLSGFFLTYEQLRHYLNINYSNSKIMYH